MANSAGSSQKGQDAASKRLDQVECAVCRIEGIEAGSPGCNGCRVGMMARYVREVLAEKFHLDFATNRWIGQCGHSWQRLDDAPPLCPYCAINNERRSLIDRIKELEEENRRLSEAHGNTLDFAKALLMEGHGHES